jgi:hypothetical protein
LLPGEESILAPAWVPWSERLADWKALQVELEAQAALEAAEAAEAEESADEDSESDSGDNWDDTDDSDDAEESEESESEDHADEAENSAQAASETDLAATNLEEGENAEGEAKDTGKRPPLFGRRNRRWGQKKNRKGDSPAE